MVRTRFKLICFVLALLGLADVASGQKYQKLENGKVERWYHPETKRTMFQTLFDGISDVIWPEKGAPFGRSIALLTGVSEYDHLVPDLPSVKNDLKDMRTFLLKEGGFDEVYVIKNRNLKRDLVERYVKKELPEKAGANGRLLFYFSGHGDDEGGNTGYMQFSGARSGLFIGQEVLKINDIQDWSGPLKVKHFLVLLDCCSSGLAFTSRGDEQCDQAILNTFSGNGSRTVLTAGTADQKTYAVQARKGKRNGIFTRAFLDAFDSGTDRVGKCGLLTIHELYGQLYRDVLTTSKQARKEVTPMISKLDEKSFKGTFVFVNTKGEQVTLTDEQIAAGDLVVKKSGVAMGDKYGTIRVISQYGGTFYLDDGTPRKVAANIALLIYPITVGKHTLKMVGADNSETKLVEVDFGGIQQVVFLDRLAGKDIPPLVQSVRVNLFRSEPLTSLTVNGVEKMLADNKFYGRRLNKEGAGFANRYKVMTRQGEKLVVDEASGLTWQRSGSSNEMVYAQTEAYIAELNDQQFSGYADWRLPTLEEAMSLMEPKKQSTGLYINPIFDKTQTWIWTADKESASFAWIVFFDAGGCFFEPVFGYYFMRAVR